MRRIHTRMFFAVLAVLAGLFICGLASAETEILAQASLTIGIDQSADLIDEADADGVDWIVGNENIVAVDNSGTVTGVTPGKTTVTVVSDAGSSETCVVTVVQSDKSVKTVNITKASVTVQTGKKTTLRASISPARATNRTVSWESSDPTVATVSSKGVVCGKRAGTVLITATASSGVTDSCIVNIRDIEVTRVRFTKSKVTLKMGSTYTVRGKVYPSNATNRYVTFSTSNDAVVTVDANGKLSAVAPGSATITATAANGVTGTCAVTVPITKVTKVKLNASKGTMYTGGTYVFTSTVTPAAATNPELEWTSSNTKIATVDDEGMVTALSAGKVKIKAAATDGSKRYAYCTITVKVDPNAAVTSSGNSTGLVPTGSGNAQLDALIQSIFKQILRDGMTPTEKLRACYDYIIKTSSYDRSVTGSTVQGRAYYLLAYHRGTCHGYNAAFMYMAKAIGYNGKMVYGKTSAAGGGYTGHYWCVLTIDGVEYIFDPQVEQNVTTNEIRYTRFGKTYAEIGEKYIPA